MSKKVAGIHDREGGYNTFFSLCFDPFVIQIKMAAEFRKFI